MCPILFEFQATCESINLMTMHTGLGHHDAPIQLSPKEAEARHPGAYDATDDGAAVHPDAHLDGLAGEWVQHLARCLQ